MCIRDRVKIVDNDLNRCNRLTELLDDKTMIINGDGRDMDLLIEEGLKNTEAFVALTGNSETNILACLAAKRMGVEKTVAEVENIDYIGMAESLDIGTVINKKMIAASHIYQMMLDADVSNVKCLTFANADVAEFTVPEGAKITKHLIKDLGLPKGTTIGGMIRNGEGILVTGDTPVSYTHLDVYKRQLSFVSRLPSLPFRRCRLRRCPVLLLLKVAIQKEELRSANYSYAENGRYNDPD